MREWKTNELFNFEAQTDEIKDRIRQMLFRKKQAYPKNLSQKLVVGMVKKYRSSRGGLMLQLPQQPVGECLAFNP